jgi:hypothetical protein
MKLTENDESFIHLYGLMMTPFRFSHGVDSIDYWI